MSCYDGASPVWGIGNAVSLGTGLTQLNTETYASKTPRDLITGFGLDCATAKSYLETGAFPQPKVIKDGASILPPDQATVIAAGGSVTCVLDINTTVGSSTYTVEGGFVSGIPTVVAGIDFLESATYSGGTAPVISSTILLSYNFDAWWCCSTSGLGCCPDPEPEPEVVVNMTSVVFDPASFKAAYPAFAAVNDAVLQNYFDMATLYLNNGACSVVQDLQKRETLLWMLTAHIAFISGALNPGGMPGVVGRVSSATEGSVSVSTEYPSTPNAAWYNQSTWGAMFWAATSSIRGFRYSARPTVVEGQHGRPFRRF